MHDKEIMELLKEQLSQAQNELSSRESEIEQLLNKARALSSKCTTLKKRLALAQCEFVEYKRRIYRLLYVGNTKHGYRAKLKFVEGENEFWVDANLLIVSNYNSYRHRKLTPNYYYDQDSSSLKNIHQYETMKSLKGKILWI